MDKLFTFFGRGFTYLTERWEDRVQEPFFQHLQITVFTLVVSLAIALPIGVLISKKKALATPVLAVLGILYTIPSLAFLALLVPATGLGFTTTVIVLITYAQTMLVRNTALGFNAIDPAITEAARGMGMSGWQIFWKVELPLALPIILAGVRVAALAIVSIATIAAFVGAGGLGQLIKPQAAPQSQAAGIILLFGIALAIDLSTRLVVRLMSNHHTPKARQITNNKLKAA
jgi:osmoprotectant transport system permease protein